MSDGTTPESSPAGSPPLKRAGRWGTLFFGPPASAGGGYAGPLRAVMILIALAGLAVTTVLAIHSADASALPGCGSGSACDSVLASPWSRWLGMPVALPAAALWLVILIAIIARWTELVVSASLLVAGAAVWFIYVSIVKLGELCPYCMAAHALAILLLIAAMTCCRRIPWPNIAHASACLLVLVIGQLMFASPAAPRHRVVQYTNLGIVVSQYPTLGDPDAEHVMVLFYDYTCPHCRALHGHLGVAMDRYGRDQFALALAPAPLNAQCNPNLTETDPRHAAACGLARAALTVWLARPDAFPAMDAWLFEADRTVADAEAYARKLVGDKAYDAHRDDPRIAEFLRIQCNLNLTIGQELHVGDTLPKLILGSPHNDIIVGKPAVAEDLFAELETRLGLTPLKSSPAP